MSHPASSISPLQLHANSLKEILLDTMDVLQNCLIYGDEESRCAAQIQCEAIQDILTATC